MPENENHPLNAMFVPETTRLEQRPEDKHLQHLPSAAPGTAADDLAAEQFHRSFHEAEALMAQLRGAASEEGRQRILAELHRPLAPHEAKAVMDMPALETLQAEHKQRLSQIQIMQEDLAGMRTGGEDREEGSGMNSLDGYGDRNSNGNDDDDDDDDDEEEDILDAAATDAPPTAGEFDRLRREHESQSLRIGELQRALYDAEQRCAEAEHREATNEARFAANEASQVRTDRRL